MDQEIGRVIVQLKERGAFDNTLIFFASDNGASAEIRDWKGRLDAASRGKTHSTVGCMNAGVPRSSLEPDGSSPQTRSVKFQATSRAVFLFLAVCYPGDLVAAKVRRLVIMGGNFVDPNQREHNIALDMEAAQTVAESWPTPIVYSGFEIGRPVMTGGALTQPEVNPVAKAYELFPAGGVGTIASSSSYDQTALHYAVRGTGTNGRTLWQLSDPGWATFPDARTRFARSSGGRHRHLIRHASDGEVAAVIEALMIQPPRRHDARASEVRPASSSESASADDDAQPGDGTATVIGESPASERPRLLVLTDIGGDPDDQQSMIRLLLYANEFELEGIIASASGTPEELKEQVVQPHLIRQIVEAYGQVRSNLIQHAKGYPVTEQLLARIKSGNPNRGRDAVGEVTDARATVWRWREAFQNDFAARLDWCVADDFKPANHNPIAVLNGDPTRGVLELSARLGDTVKLSAAGSHDPDGHPFTTTWFVYREAVTVEVSLNATSAEVTSFVAPSVQEPVTIHVVLQLEDQGTPCLFAYRRAIVTVRP